MTEKKKKNPSFCNGGGGAVGLLQATDVVQLRGGNGSTGGGLLQVEQRADGTVLRVRLLQGGGAGGRAAGLAQTVGAEHSDGGCPDRNILHRLLRLPERQAGRNRLPLRPQPHVQGPP